MEVMDELSFKILADGQQQIQINEFRYMDVELGIYEKNSNSLYPKSIPQYKLSLIQQN